MLPALFLLKYTYIQSRKSTLLAMPSLKTVGEGVLWDWAVDCMGRVTADDRKTEEIGKVVSKMQAMVHMHMDDC